MPDNFEGEELLNRTMIMTEEQQQDDPLDITPKEPEPEPEAEVAAEEPASEVQKETEEPEEGAKEPEEKPESEVFVKNLDAALLEKTGVDLAGITEALVELLTWRNDILALETQQQQQPKSSRTNSNNIPPVVRPGGREGIQARNYDFRQSEIDAMDTATYTKNRQAITNAYLQGRVLKDR